MINVEDPLEVVLLNREDDEKEGLVEYAKTLQGMRSYSYGPRKLSLDLENRKTPPTKPSIEEPPTLELKPFPSHLRSKKAIGWTLADIRGISPAFCMHKIILVNDANPSIEHQRRLNEAMQEVIKKDIVKWYDVGVVYPISDSSWTSLVVKKEILKWLDAGVVYPISDSSWTSLVQCVLKKGGMTVVTNEKNELIPTRTVTIWRVCMDYRKLNKVTRKYHFPLPFLDQMLDRLAGRAFYCFLDGYSGYNQILIASEDQEKTTFTCPYGTFAFSRMPFGLCNTPATFQWCMMAIFTDMVEDVLEVFMDDFSVGGDSFEECLDNLDKVLARCEETNLVLNWEKCHFMVEEGIFLGHKISKDGIEVEKAKIEVISKLPPPTSVKGVRSFLGHARFYRRFIKDFSELFMQYRTVAGKICLRVGNYAYRAQNFAVSESFSRGRILSAGANLQSPEYQLSEVVFASVFIISRSALILRGRARYSALSGPVSEKFLLKVKSADAVELRGPRSGDLWGWYK
uniref:Reverse transcriptase domain-containing protein n=1 Tax=Nicotiana tabacum TaxID=4097 RepID=A0A1S3XPU6_TOBAC|nr:PREDICTED: uncharacterized protein LOC107767401 [Nicotiana tabacum]